MSFEPLGPGKTAPKLLQDFLVFDPIKGVPNVLALHSPPHGEGAQLAPAIGSCRHEYTTKVKQSIVPPLDLRPDGGTTYRLAVVCKKCRIHADVRIDHSNSTNPCPTHDNPVHHFQRVDSFDKTTAERIRYAWQCSVEECHATLFIFFRRPVLNSGEIDLLVNPERLKKRYEALSQEDPTREGLRMATPMESLSRLRRYIKDSLNTGHERRHFPSNNKRFQEAFGINGQDCHEILERLGFKYADHVWTLPNPAQISDRSQTDGSTTREKLEDVELELLAYMFKLSSEQGLNNPHSEEGWHSADRDIERTLAAQGYTRHVSPRRTAWSNAELPFFNSLGALPDFSDSLVEYSYDRQIICDPVKQMYYVECLQEITESRNSEQLQIKVATLQSQNIVSRRDISAAYRYFNFAPIEAQSISDSRILGEFQARQSDLGAAAQEQARGHLYKLGIARQSQRLISASSQSVDTYEDALSWLGNGATTETPDDHILAILAIRTADSRANEEIGQKAISTIAKARRSNMLNNWLLTGRADGYTMSVDEALRHLNIEQDLNSIDPTVLPAIFDSARVDRPGDTTEKAIATIQQNMSGPTSTAPTHAPESWPVGLTSHGNTCYLNSLLQYYFSIKPLRNIVLNYDDNKLDTSAYTEKVERVGQLKVTMVEIKGGQRFAEDLRQLFEQMIKSPYSSVKPQEDLVCRAFLDPKQYRLLDAQPKDDIQSDNTDNTDNTMVNGVVETTEDKLTDGETLASPLESHQEEAHLSDASSTTLQVSTNGDDSDVTMKNVEMPPTPPASPGLKGSEQPKPDSAPPPLPPRRRFSTAKEEALEIAKKKARDQQDVTEVHDAAMFRLRCGIMPRGRDSDEEQIDALRDLFSMEIEETIVKDGVEQKPKVLADSNIQVNVPREPTDIYSALDAVFDLQPYGENSPLETYKSIRALPPLLQVNIPRIDYDETRAGASTGAGAFKSLDMVRLEDELYLDRYSSEPEVLDRRRRCWEWRKTLRALKLEKTVLSKTPTDLDSPTVFAQSAEYLNSLDAVNVDLRSIGLDPIAADSDVTAVLSADAEKQASRLVSLQAEIDDLQKKVDTEFADTKAVKYRLAAVFFHRGRSGGGHYWIYIHDFTNNVWRIYNDDRVDAFTDLNKIFEAKTYDDGTPTYAVYVDANKLDLVEPVCRDPEKLPTPEPMPTSQPGPDVEMTNGAPPITTIDPKLTIEGGESSWDTPRQVVEDVTCRSIKDNLAVRRARERLSDDQFAAFMKEREFALRRSRAQGVSPSPPPRSPKRRDSIQGGGSPPKVRRGSELSSRSSPKENGS